MKSIVLIIFLMIFSNVCFAAQNTCETGYACSLDKLRVMEEENNKKQDIIKEENSLKQVKYEKDKTKKDYKDFFIFIKPKE